VARQFHLRALRADPAVDLVAVADPEPAALAAAAAAGVETHSAPAELIGREDVEAIVVCAPPAAHAELAERTLAAGKHLYLEKPIALDVTRARALAAAVPSRTVAAVGFSYRFNPAFAALRERVARGEIGRVREARCLHHEPGLGEGAPRWKTARASGGGAALDLVSHAIDMARWLLGDEPAAVEEATIDSVATEGDDLRAAVRMRGGARIEIGASYVRGRGHRWDLTGDDGALVADRWPPRARRRRRATAGIGALRRGLLALPIPRREPSFRIALGRFARAARGAPRGDLATLEDGVASLEGVLAVERAAGIDALPT
jgi:myo-inositol 2-dehydrogenase/D-chiro-inositol 1-dehydrogenase